MNRTMIAAVGLVATLPLAACQKTPAPNNQETTPAEVPAPAPTTPSVTTPPATNGMGAVALALDSTTNGSTYLTDQSGRAVYLFTKDTNGQSTCDSACAQAWPPVTTQQSQPTVSAQGLDPSKVGTIQRPDGTMQVTYNGHPLYYYAQDQGAGQIMGQDVHGFGGEWYLVTTDGDKAENIPAPSGQ